MQGLARVLATVLLAALAAPAAGQIAAPNEAGVAMGHLHYHVRDIEANARFWVALGGERAATSRRGASSSTCRIAGAPPASATPC